MTLFLKLVNKMLLHPNFAQHNFSCSSIILLIHLNLASTIPSVNHVYLPFCSLNNFCNSYNHLIKTTVKLSFNGNVTQNPIGQNVLLLK